MKIYIIAFLAIALFIAHEANADDSYWYARAGLGHNTRLFDDNDWDDGGEIGGSVGFGYRHRLSGGFYGTLSYDHYSQPAISGSCNGRPLGASCEDSLDAFYAGVEYHW